MIDALVCDAGRRASYGGRWNFPCLNQPARNVLAFSAAIGGERVDGTPVLRFCDEHMGRLVADGLINEALVDDAEWDRRVAGDLS